jgi:hypothetical protein
MADQRETQKWWLSLPGILTAVGAVITAITGLLIGLHQAGLLGDEDSPTTSSTPTAPASGTPASGSMFRGFVLSRPSIEIRTEPELSSQVVGYLSYGTEVFIVCTAIGDPVQGPGAGGGPSVTTPVWDKVRTRADDSDLGFVPDAWIKTGTTKPQAPGCN